MNATQELAERRSKLAEVEQLRTFYMLWCQMHATLNDKEAESEKKQQASQRLVEQAHKLKAFYG